MTTPNLTAEPVIEDSALLDVLVTRDGKTTPILGSGGKKRELAILSSLSDGKTRFMPGEHLPVLIGSGAGFAALTLAQTLSRELGENFTLAVVDREEPILEASGIRETLSGFPSIRWIQASTPDAAIQELTAWQAEHGGKPMYHFSHPFYLRYDKAYYGAVREAAMASARFNL